MRQYLIRAAYAVAKAFGASPIVERASAPKSGMRVIPDLALWYQYQRIGGAMTPQRLSQILRAADTGDLAEYVDVANDARQKDGHLQGILSQVEMSLAELDWTLSLPDNAKATDKRNMAFVEEALKQATGTDANGLSGFASLVAHLAGSFYIGHQVSESIWVKDAKGRLVVTGWNHLAARRFGYRQSDGAFVWRDSGMTEVEIQKEYPNKFVVSQPRVNGDVPCREGLARVLLWAALFRNWSMSDWLRTAELAWKPWRIGTYEKGASDPDIEALRTVMQDLITTGTAVLPETAKFEVKWAGGGSGGTGKPTHAELFNVVAQEMSKAALGATETVQASTSSGYAQAKVHQGVSATLMRARARHIAAVLIRDVIRPMIRLNFGKRALVPTLRFTIEEQVDIAAFGAGIEKLVNAGLEIPQSWVRQKIGAPAPKGDEPILIPLSKPAPTAATDAKPPSSPEDGPPVPEAPDDQGDAEDAPEAADEAA